MNVTSYTAQIAGATGLIDADLATSISESSESIGKAAEAITPEQEYYIGRAVAGTIFYKYKVYHAPEVQLYLNKISKTLVMNSDKPVLYKGYYVEILDSDEINAFATSGGHILITKGLLSCANSEDALAAVLAHEISHIQLQHSIKAIKSSRATDAILKTAEATYVAAVGKDAKLELVDGLKDSVNDIVTIMVESGYSKIQEFAADENALKLMKNANYNTNAMNDMLLMLKEKSSGQTKGFCKTHPTPDARMNKLKKKYSSYKDYQSQVVRTERFKKIISSL